MEKITIRIWNNYSFNKTAWIQIDNSNLENIWEYINRLKINKNRINDFRVRLHENGFIYNIGYNIKNYRRFVNNLIKRFKKLEIYCELLIIDMDEEKEYKLGKKKFIFTPNELFYISNITFPPPIPLYEKDMKFVKYRKIKVPKSVIDKIKFLFIKYIKNELKRLNLWIDEMEGKKLIKKVILSDNKGGVIGYESDMEKKEIIKWWKDIEIKALKAKKWLFKEIKKINKSNIEKAYKFYAKQLNKELTKEEKRKAFNKAYIKMNEVLLERTKERIKKEIEK